MFPFVAIFIGTIISRVKLLLPRGREGIATFIAVPFVLSGVSYFFHPAYNAPLTLGTEEAAVAKIYKAGKENNTPLYAIAWPHLETLTYYAGTKINHVDPLEGLLLKGPFYAVVPVGVFDRFFYRENGEIKNKLDGEKLLFQGKHVLLIYSVNDFQTP